MLIVGVVLLPVRRLLAQTISVGRLAASKQRNVTFIERLDAEIDPAVWNATAEIRDMARLTKAQYDTMVRSNVLVARSTVLIEPAIVATGFLFVYVAVQHFEAALGTVGMFLFVLLRMVPIIKSIVTVRQSMLAALGSLEMVGQRLGEMEEDSEIQTETDSRGEEQYPIRQCFVPLSSGNGRGFEERKSRVRSRENDRPCRTVRQREINLIDLLPRLRWPQEGEITVDGIPIEDFEPEPS